MDLIDFLKKKGRSSSDLYVNYLIFYQYVCYFEGEGKDLNNLINQDASKINKHILASIRIYDFLSCLPSGAYFKIDLPITYFRKIDFKHWNNVRSSLALKEHTSKSWKKQITDFEDFFFSK